MDKTLPVTPVEMSKTTLNGIINARKISSSQLVYCHAGSGELFSENSLPVKFGRGDMIFLSSSLLYGYDAENCEVSMLSFTGSYELLLAEYMTFNTVCVINGCSDCEKLFGEQLCSNDEDEIKNSLKLYELITRVGIKNLENIEKRSTVDGFLIDKITDYIAENYSKTDFSLNAAYIAAGTSKRTADTVFRLNTGMSTEEYYRFFKLENMRKLLFIRPFLNLERCAVTNGFISYNEFKAEFIAEYNITPEQFVDSIGCNAVYEEVDNV